MNKKENKISKEIKINKKSARRNYSNQTGITLIALVVTIVVLLILAGVSLNAIFSENGIINRAKDAGMTRQDWILSVVTPQLNGGVTKNEEVVTPLIDPQPDIKLCPECGAAMQIKNGRRGKFWGCTNYPRCHHTEDWNGN